MADETISEKCETLYNKLNSFVASVISRDVTPKISNLNTEVWGSDTQTGNSRIDTLNTNFNNLDSSITTMESDINNVESDVSNLQTSVNSLNTSITNLGSWSTANFGSATVYYNDYFVYVSITQESNTNTVPTTYSINISSTYAPPSNINVASYTMYSGNPYAFARINTNGVIEVTINRATYNSSGGVKLHFGVLYPRI